MKSLSAIIGGNQQHHQESHLPGRITVTQHALGTVKLLHQNSPSQDVRQLTPMTPIPRRQLLLL